MLSFLSKARKIHRRHWILLLMTLGYIVYLALAYFYLPGRLKQALETDVSQLIGRDIAVDRIDVNPFRISFKVGYFTIADQPGKPLVGWQQFLVNVGFLKSIFKWEIALDDLSVDKPEINIEKHTDRFNFTDILERLNAKGASEDPSNQPTDKRTHLALEIIHSSINQGVFRFTDLSGTSPAQCHLGDITIELKDLYFATGDEHLNPFDLTAKIPGGGDLRLAGEYRIDPLHVDAEVIAEQVQLSTFSGFVENILPMKLNGGLLSFTTRILANQETDFQFRVNEGRLRITDLVLDDNIANPSLLRADSIQVTDAVLDLVGKNLTLGGVTLDGITVPQWLDTAGKFRYERLLKKEPDRAGPLTPEPSSRPLPASDEPWRILVKQVGLKNGTLHFSDQNEAITVDHTLSKIALDLENVTLTRNEKVLVRFSSLLDAQGLIGVDGVLTLSPFSMDLDYRLEKMKLPLFSEYMETTAFLRVDKGSLSADGNVSMEGKGSLMARLDLTMGDFKLTDTRTGNALFSFGALKLDDVELNPDDRKISIASLGLLKPEVTAEMSAEKKLNLASLSKPGNDAAPVADQGKTADSDESADWAFYIEKIELQDGTAHFTDKSVTPVFKTALYDLSLAVDSLSTSHAGTTPFLLSGNLDRYAPFTMKGTLASLNKQPGFTFSSRLDGLEMPSLSPYAAAFIGNHLKSGKLSLSLDYSVKNRKLRGTNNIVAKNLFLGEKVPGEPAIKAPVAVGLALLRDTKGVIDLDVGVSGDLDDPGFSVSGIVIKALVNIFVKAAASPFKLLGTLVGGREDLGEIDFAEGLATLSQNNQVRLKQLATALTQRPQLALRIKGNAGDRDDGPVLQALGVEKKVAAARKITPAALRAEAGNAAWWTLPKNQDVLGDLNAALDLPTALERATKLQTENPALKDKALMADVYRQLVQEVASVQKIETAELVSLADRRALAIKQYLVDVLGLEHQRVSVTKAQQSALTGRVITLEIEAL